MEPQCDAGKLLFPLAFLLQLVQERVPTINQLPAQLTILHYLATSESLKHPHTPTPHCVCLFLVVVLPT